MDEYGAPHYFCFKSNVEDSIYINHLRYEISDDEIAELESPDSLKDYSLCSIFKLFYSDAFGSDQEITITYIWDAIDQLNEKARLYMPGTYST
jgi:hypothetical protein